MKAVCSECGGPENANSCCWKCSEGARRVVVYLRVSTDRQDERNQEPDCLRICAARGWTDPVIVRETGSGARDRPEWMHVQDLARRGILRAVVIWSLDRIGRRMFELIADVRELDRVGCAVVSVREPWLDTSGPTRALLLAIMGWVAEHERERLRERTVIGMAAARARGARIGRPPVNLSPETVRNALRLRAAGASWSVTAETLGASSSSLRRAVRRAGA
jgi:putative DNA-invertase from lambdoid prophage Rac